MNKLKSHSILLFTKKTCSCCSCCCCKRKIFELFNFNNYSRSPLLLILMTFQEWSSFTTKYRKHKTCANI